MFLDNKNAREQMNQSKGTEFGGWQTDILERIEEAPGKVTIALRPE